jgi:hypothetical protein
MDMLDAICEYCNQMILPGESSTSQHTRRVHLRCQQNNTFQEPWRIGKGG